MLRRRTSRAQAPSCNERNGATYQSRVRRCVYTDSIWSINGHAQRPQRISSRTGQTKRALYSYATDLLDPFTFFFFFFYLLSTMHIHHATVPRHIRNMLKHSNSENQGEVSSLLPLPLHKSPGAIALDRAVSHVLQAAFRRLSFSLARHLCLVQSTSCVSPKLELHQQEVLMTRSSVFLLSAQCLSTLLFGGSVDIKRHQYRERSSGVLLPPTMMGFCRQCTAEENGWLARA
jgi:hypothetical protein